MGGDSTAQATPLLKPWQGCNPLTSWHSKLVTLNFDLMRNSDSHGVVPGLMKSALNAGLDTLRVRTVHLDLFKFDEPKCTEN